ncbi:LPXTG cell wall anchor domain-containing protein [Streptococcus phocae subsp. phocae]
MKSYTKLSTSLLAATALSGMVLVSDLTTTTVKAHSAETAAVSKPSESFTFVATILDNQGNTLRDKTVTLTDITNASKEVIQTKTSDAKGQAIFSHLPTNRSLSVAVDGHAKGHTIRTSEANTTMAASFTAEGVGEGEPSYTQTPLDVSVYNQDGEPIADKEVTLKAPNGTLIETLKTNQDGLARFTNQLMDGTFYQYFVDGKKMGQTVPGFSASAFLEVSKETHTHQHHHDSHGEASHEHFTFTATVLDQNDQGISGKKVTLFDITDGHPHEITSGQTNEEGKIFFESLPLARNISVFVDGESQGYTFRTDQKDQNKAAAFYSKGQGTGASNYTKKPLIITVVDENGNALAGQLVTLTNKLGKVVAEIKTDDHGRASFTDKLMDGTFYEFAVNQIKMHAVTPGNDISAALETSQISHDSEHDHAADKMTKETQKDQSANTSKNADDTHKMDSHKQHTDNGQKATAPKLSKGLPQTGEHGATILTVVGFVILGLASIIGLAKKKDIKS